MNYRALIKAVTMGDTRRVRPVIIWSFLEYFLRGAPYGILLAAVWELFKPLQTPGTQLNFQALWLISAGMLVSLVLLYLVSRVSYNKMYHESYSIGTEGRIHMADHLRKLSMGFFNSRDPGTIGSYLITDYANVEFLLSHLLPQIIGAAAMPMILLAALAVQDWRMALASALVIPIALPMAWISKRLVTMLGKKHQVVKTEAGSRMLEYLQGIRLIKAFNLTGTGFIRLEKTFRLLKVRSIKLEAGVGPTMILASFILHGGLTVIILLGLTFLFAGSLPLPAYLMFLIIGSRVYEPLIQALMFMAEMNYFSLSVERIEELRKTPILAGTSPECRPEGYDIEFRDVSFRYNDIEVVKRATFSMPEKSLTALVGPSGSGKTTMTRLIARFWDVTEGRIMMGGKDIRSLEPEILLASISMVFQDVYLFNDTVLNNIRVGDKRADMDQVLQAAKTARCHDFIEKLPNGYESMIGEGGSTLSGGEKQRISIARAILKDAPVVLLDEATASLDPENELYIQEAINDLVKNKTVVVIAHRLNTVVGADRIIVLDEGRIVESGKHDALMRAGGLYRKMWDEQQSARTWTFRERKPVHGGYVAGK